MEAATLQKKKTINKGKIKKTLKNVLCRPDPVFWPLVTDDQKNILETALNKHRVDIPEFTKMHWKDLKKIPKDERPKPPKIMKVEGLFFGTSECQSSIKNNSCAAVIIESTVNPRAIVQPVIEACVDTRVPIICINGLKTISASNFGIPTSCLGIKCDCLSDLRTVVQDIAMQYKPPQITKEEDIEMGDATEGEKLATEQTSAAKCPYLYRSNKKTRVFNPSQLPIVEKNITNFSGQDFIEFSKKKEPSDKVSDRKSYMKMVLKKISNNPKRVKVK